MTTKEKIEQLAYWLVFEREKPETCPKVGYLGWSNGWTKSEWAVVCVINDVLRKANLDIEDYFTWKTDSSD